LLGFKLLDFDLIAMELISQAGGKFGDEEF